MIFDSQFYREKIKVCAKGVDHWGVTLLFTERLVGSISLTLCKENSNQHCVCMHFTVTLAIQFLSLLLRYEIWQADS